MKFSLINVTESKDLFCGSSRIVKESRVSGYFLQNHIGTLETARVVAKETEAANGNRIRVAVVDEIPSSRPEMNHWKNLIAL